MRLKLIALLLFSCFAVHAQSFKYPLLKPHGKTIKSLMLPRWKIIDSVSGDLNDDKINDLVLIYEFYAAVKENRAYGDSTTELITEIQKPRILAIYFKKGKNYKMVTQNNHFILRSEEGGAMGDPLRPITITGNVLNLAFEGGGNWKWKLNYSFRYQNKDWALTRASNYAYQSPSGEMNSKLYDFENKKKLITIGKTGNKDAENKIVEQNLNLNRLRTFSSFKKPWTWELGPDEFL